MDFGAIENVDPRELWPREDEDFTPWLAENIDFLAEALGIDDLEVEEQEADAGRYNIDILGTTRDEPVVVENLFGEMDHDHMGKALTYAADKDASVIIWVSDEWTPEHRKLVSYLNRYTTEDVSFYAVQLEVIRVNDSPPAVRFTVLSGPGEKPTPPPKKLSATERFKLMFWTSVRDEVLGRGIVRTARTPGPGGWYGLRIGRSGFEVAARCSPTKSEVSVFLWMSSKVGSAIDVLREDQEAIEAELGAPEWKDERREKLILLRQELDAENWLPARDWVVRTMGEFVRVFKPRVLALQL